MSTPACHSANARNHPPSRSMPRTSAMQPALRAAHLAARREELEALDQLGALGGAA